MRKINFLLVATMLVALAVPAKQTNAATIIGIQGGYVRQNLHSIRTKVGSANSTTTKRANWGALKNAQDMQGGFFEINFDKKFSLSKMLYVGAGVYFQYAGTKNIKWSAVYDQKLTHNFAIGPELVVGFNVIPLLDVTLRAGVGFAASFGPKYAGIDRTNYYGLNWRILPGITVKFGKIGVFVEGGYVGNLLQHSATALAVTTKTTNTWHGGQIGAGVKFYL